MNYNIEMINLLSELYPIQPQLAFYKVDDKIVLKAQEVRQKLAYKLEAPAEYFDFPAESLRFYDFKKFMDFFNTFNIESKDEQLKDTPILDATLLESGEIFNIIIQSSKGKQKFSYRAAVRGTVDEPEFNNLALPTVCAKVLLTEAQINHLRKMVNLIYDKSTPGGIKIDCYGDTMKVTLNNIVSSNSYEIEYKLNSPATKDFSVTINREGLLLLPSAAFDIEIGPKGMIFYMQRDDSIKLTMAISYMKA